MKRGSYFPPDIVIRVESASKYFLRQRITEQIPGMGAHCPDRNRPARPLLAQPAICTPAYLAAESSFQKERGGMGPLPGRNKSVRRDHCLRTRGRLSARQPCSSLESRLSKNPAEVAKVSNFRVSSGCPRAKTAQATVFFLLNY